MSGRPTGGDPVAAGTTDGKPAGSTPVAATDADSGPPGATLTGPPRHRHPFLNYIWHTVIAVISAFVLLITGVYWNIVSAGAAQLDAGSVDAGLGSNGLVTAVPSIQSAAAGGAGGAIAPTQQAVYSPENFLLVGSDTRAGANNIDGSEGELAGVANTDSVMILHISADRQHISAVSLPRDMWMPNVACEAYDQTTNTYGGKSAGDGYEKLHVNSFYGVGGPKCLVDAVENLTQLTITRYIQIDFAGFAAMVDALGGVTINACGPIIDETLSTVLAAGGEQTIDGYQALNLARARKVEGDTSSDLARIHRQQLILSAILREVKSAGTLLDPAKLSNFVTAFTQNTTTAGVDFESLMDLAQSIGDLDPAKVTFYTVPTIPDEKDTARGSMFIDPTNSAALLGALRADQPVPGTDPPAETPSAASTIAAEITSLTVAPSAVDLQIVNASSRDGLAGEASAALEKLGFVVQDDDLKRDETGENAITVEYSAGNEAAALTVASAVTGATLVQKDGRGSLVSLRLGGDYQGDVTAVAAGDPIRADLLAAVPAGSAGNVITATTSADAPETSASTSSVNASDTSCL